MENITEWFNNFTLPTGLFEYVIIAAVIVAIMALLRKIFPTASMIVNIVIAVAAVILAFKNLHWWLALRAVVIFLVLMFIVKIIASLSEKPGVTASIRYKGKGQYETTYHLPKQNTDDNRSNASNTRYKGKDADGNDVFEFTSKKR
ncbi:MAG: hypothetical protein LBI14_03855 [Treponema sp.]|jgi:ABC-type transport system involved in cytochrome bd biosynthesis fused ATPase/permease subunit|nr:hypothetical protein [Treponema sp.]